MQSFFCKELISARKSDHSSLLKNLDGIGGVGYVVSSEHWFLLQASVPFYRGEKYFWKVSGCKSISKVQAEQLPSPKT